MRKYLLLLILTNLSSIAYAQPLARPQNYIGPTQSEMEVMTPTDRAAVSSQYSEFVSECGWDAGRSSSCGEITSIPQGDPNFKDPRFQKIPRPTALYVKTECEPSSGLFYTTVYYKDPTIKDPNKQWINFKNPVGKASKNSTDSLGNERWLTSPGLYDYEGADGNTPVPLDPKKVFRTPTGRFSGEGKIVMVHVVSDAYDYKGTEMPFTVWVEGSVAYHASKDELVTGHPESHGCMRLQWDNARALFAMVRIAGTSNVTYNFAGYGPIDPKTNRPACDGSKRGTNVIAKNDQFTPYSAIQIQSTAARQNILQRFFNSVGRGRAQQQQPRQLFRYSPSGVPAEQ